MERGAQEVKEVRARGTWGTGSEQVGTRGTGGGGEQVGKGGTGGEQVGTEGRRR